MKSLLANRSFVWLWAGQFLSLAGDWGRDMALLFWVFQSTAHSPLARAGILIAQFGPSLVVSPFAGVLVDRLRARNVLIYCDVLRAIVAGLQVWAASTNNLGAVLILMVISSVAAQFFVPARSVLTREIVPQEGLYAANSLSNALYNTMTVMGPVLGSTAYFALGTPSLLAFDGATFLVSAACVAAVPLAPRVETTRSRTGMIQDFKDGVSYATARPALRGLFAATGALLLGTGLAAVTDIFLVTDVLQLPENRVAWMQTVQGASMLVASLLLGYMANRLPRPSIGFTLSLLTTAGGLWITGAASGLFILLLGGTVIGIGDTASSISGGTLLQTEVESKYLGRVAGVYQSLCRGAFLVSSMIAGIMLNWLGVRLLLAMAGAIIVVGAGANLIMSSGRKIGKNIAQ